MAGIRNVLNNPIGYQTIYEKDMRALTEGYGFFLSMDDAAR
jgi:hypothetical protein